MRKLIVNLAVSLDGFVEGPNGEYDWCFNDQDYGMEEFFAGVDAIFMGRKSYDLLTGSGDIAHMLMRKIYLFSDTLTMAAFDNISILTNNNLKEKIVQIKEEEGGNIWLFGGAGLTSSLFGLGVVDELHLSIHPIILGGGKPLLHGFRERTYLNLVETTPYKNSLVQLRYQVLPKIDLNDIAGFAD